VKSVEIIINKGMISGQQIVLSGQGNQELLHESGDIVITLVEKETPTKWLVPKSNLYYFYSLIL